MAIISPPAYQQGGTYSARTDRLSVITGLLGYHGSSADEASLRTRSGVRPSYQGREMQVSAQATPNMTVSVSAGISYVQNKDLANYGAYTLVNDAPVTVPIAASSGSQYRKDTIVAQVLDAETLGTVNSGALVVVQGPYAASAGATTRGTLPPNCTVLADVAVDAGVTSITSAKIVDARQFQVASGGILPVVSTAVPDHPAPGQVMYLTDTSVLRYGRQDGTTRQILTDEQITAGAWNAYTPTWSGVTMGSATTSGRWCRTGRRITAQVTLTWGSGSSMAGSVAFSLPVSASGLGQSAQGTGWWDDPNVAFRPVSVISLNGSPAVANIFGFTTTQQLTNPTNVYSWSSTASVHAQIEYEAAN